MMWSRCSRQKPLFINASLLKKRRADAVPMPVSFLRLEAQKHLSESYNEPSKHTISVQHFCLSSATKVICMRTASLSLPSAPDFAPVVNMSLFLTHDSPARLQEMRSVYRRAIPKRARITPWHRRVGPRQRCFVFVNPHTSGRKGARS